MVDDPLALVKRDSSGLTRAVGGPCRRERSSQRAGAMTSLPVAFGAQIAAAASRHQLDPRLLAAVAAQETGGPGSDSGRNIVGDGGHGRGLFQIDDRWHAFARDPAAHGPGPQRRLRRRHPPVQPPALRRQREGRALGLQRRLAERDRHPHRLGRRQAGRLRRLGAAPLLPPGRHAAGAPATLALGRGPGAASTSGALSTAAPADATPGSWASSSTRSKRLAGQLGAAQAGTAQTGFALQFPQRQPLPPGRPAHHHRRSARGVRRRRRRLDLDGFGRLAAPRA